MISPAIRSREMSAFFWLGLGLLAAFAFSVPATAQSFQWIHQFGSIRTDIGLGAAADSTGVYVVGRADDALPGQTFTTGGVSDVFVRKYDLNGSEQWTREFGSASIPFLVSGNDQANGVAVNGTGVYVVGLTDGVLPGQVNAGGQSGGNDAFVRKYDAGGGELWTRQFGTAAFFEQANGVALDATGVYVVGQTSGTFPGQSSAGGIDVFLRKYDANGGVVWTRQFGSAAADCGVAVATDATGVYVAGLTGGTNTTSCADNVGPWDAFVRKFDSSGNELWNRQFGTSAVDRATAVTTDDSGLYVAGYTQGSLPGQVSTGGNDAFVRKYDANGNELWTRQFGSAADDVAQGIAANASGVYVGGSTNGALPGQTSAGNQDAFWRRYDASGSEVATSQFGSANPEQGNAMAADATGAYVAGSVSGTLPGQTGAGSADVFVGKLTTTVVPPGSPAVNDGGVLNNASYLSASTSLAPGSIVAIFGTNLNDGSQVTAPIVDGSGHVATTLGGATVKFNGIAAPLFYSFPSQIGAQIPYELAGQAFVQITVTVAGQTSDPQRIFIAPTAPGIFTLNQAGSGPGAVLNQDSSVNSSSAPAKRGAVVQIYCTGLGLVNPPAATGVLAGVAQTTIPTMVTIDGLDATVQYAGTAPGFVGLNQVNAFVPQGARIGNDVTLKISIRGFAESNTATIAVGP
jgi:uncharacterized protein (TIGR03437 family)